MPNSNFSAGSLGKKKGRSWSLSCSNPSSSSASSPTLPSSPAPTSTSTTSTSFRVLTPSYSLDSIHDSFPSTGPASPSSSSTREIPSSPRSPQHSLSKSLERLQSLKRKMALPIQRSYSQSHAHGRSKNSGLGQGATVVRTPMDATAHMQHASISHSMQSTQSRQKCVQYPVRQSSLRSANGSSMVVGAYARRPSVGASAAPAQVVPCTPRIEPSLEGPASEDEKVEIQLLQSPRARSRNLYQTGQSVDWSHRSPSISSSHHQSHESIQFPPHPYQQQAQPLQAQASSLPTLPPLANPQGFTRHKKPSFSVSYSMPHIPQTHGSMSAVGAATGPGLVRSASSKSSIAGPQTPVTPGMSDRPERSDSRSEGHDTLDIDLSLGCHRHRHRLTSATGRSSVTITANDAHTHQHMPPSLAPSSHTGHNMQRLGSHNSLIAPSPTPSGHSYSPSVASVATTIDEESSLLPRLPGPMPQRRPSQTSKADGPFMPVVVGHSIRPSTQTSTLITLRFAFSLDTDPNTHTVTVTLDTLRPAGGRLLQFIEDNLRPSSRIVSSAESVNSVYSTTANENGAEQGPDMTDGSSAESAEDSDFEYDANRFYQEEYLEVISSGSDERVSPVPTRLERARRTPLSSCPTPLPPLAEQPIMPSSSRNYPACPSSAGSCGSLVGWGSASVSRQSSQRSQASQASRTYQRKRASTCPSASGVVTELTVLLQRDASSWHAIASRLCSGHWPLLDGKRKRVEAECIWAGMAGLAEELSGNPHFRRGYL